MDLKKGQLTFLDPTKLTADIISQLTPEASQWLEKAHQTAQVKDHIAAQISAFRASPQAADPTPENSIATVVPAEDSVEPPFEEGY